MSRSVSALFILGVCFFLLILPTRLSYGYTTTIVFTPPYYNSSKWSTALVPHVSWGTAGANFNSGSVGVYAAGWIGAGKAFADQFIKFYVPAKSTIKVEVKLKYLGGTITWGFASWSGTQWQWNIDNGKWHLYDIDPALGWDDVCLKILDFILSFAGGPVGKISQAILLCDMINDAAQMAYQLANYGGKTLTAKFSLTVNEGYHTLGFGIAAYASGCLTGTGFAAMVGQVQKITLQITNDCAPPDLTISHIEFPDEPLRINKPATIKIGISNNGSVAYNDKISLQLGTYTTTRGGYEECFDQHSTINHYCDYSFPQKGSYLVKALADPDNMVPETNETNNEFTTYTRVLGDPPNKPWKPGAVPSVCYRNHTYNFWTSGNDPDNDPLRYNFRVRDELGNEWYSAWSSSTFTAFTPTKENKMAQTGTHYVSARTIDNDGLVSPWSDEAVFFIEENTAPEQPVIDAPGKSYCGENHNTQIWFSSDDAEDDDYWFWIDWGDGSALEKIPAAGQDSRTAYHKYTTPGTYTIQAQAEDEYGAKSSVDSWNIKIESLIPPQGSIIVTTNNPDATFTINKTGGGSYNGSGLYWEKTNAETGTYTITFGSISGYYSPPSITRVLGANETIIFNGEYTHQTGTIQVTTNRPDATFKLYGVGTAQSQVYSGAGNSWSKNDCYVGDYTIYFEPVSGYCLPPTHKQSKTLGKDATITFAGNYLLPPVAVLDFYTTRTFVVEMEEPVEFDGSASYIPPPPVNPAGLYIAKYEFNFNDGTPGYAETSTDAPDEAFDGKTVHVFPKRGTYKVVLTVYDQYGNKSQTTGVVSVKARPEIYYMSVRPSPGIAGENISFDGRGWDPDGDTIVAYAWRSSIDGILSSSRTFSSDDLTTGDHIIYFKVKDSDGLWSKESPRYLAVMTPKKWDMFKVNALRNSSQSAYRGRYYGLLNYSVVWSYLTGGPITGSPVAADIDGDLTNGLEIAFTSNDGKLYLVDNAGNLLWSRVVGPGSSTPAIEALMPGGTPCIVVGGGNSVFAFDKQGNQLWQFIGGGIFNSTPVIADINFNSQDGKEIIIGCSDGKVYAIRANGTLRWQFTALSPPPNNQFIGSAAVADIDQQRWGMESVIGCQDGRVYVVDTSGTLVAKWPPGAPVGQIYTTPAIAHLVPNAAAPGGVETNIVLGSDDGHVYCLWYNAGALTLSWQYPASGNPPLAMVRSSPGIGAVGYGGKAQVVFGCDNGTVYVLKGADGTCVGTFNCGGGTMVRSSPAIANIDTINNIHPLQGDQPEVIFGATDGKLYAVSFSMGAGQNLPWSPLNLSAGPPAQPLNSSPAVADINHDPDLEIIIGSMNNRLYNISALKIAGAAPVANFAGNPLNGNPPLAVSFTDQSTGNPFNWSWDFGDGETTSTQHPTYTYDTPGTYSVSLIVTNAHGESAVTKNNYIIVNPVPVAGFSYSPASGTAPFSVNFTDQSQYNPTSWSWSFGDSSISHQQNPSHQYNTPGVYSVSLTATNAFGSDTITRTNCIIVLAPQPIADFTQDATNGKVPLTVNFTDLSTGGPTSWRWKFGDGGSSTEQNPSHTYTIPGNYLVSLTVSNSRGSDTKTSSVFITVDPQTDSVMIPNVPDVNQPPSQTLPSTDPTNFCAPIAAVNITEYWDKVIKHTNALAVDAGLTSQTVAEYIGYFMDTNNTGSADRGNDSDAHKGTYAKDEASGLLEFVRWDTANLYHTPPPSLPATKLGYYWQINTDYFSGWEHYCAEIDAGRPSLVNFLYWNPQATGITLYNIQTGEEIEIYSWGNQISSSLPGNPEETWNLQTGNTGTGHTVTGVGYIENWDPDDSGPLPASNFAIVHDTWNTTAKNVGIPWRNWNATVSVDVTPPSLQTGSYWVLYK